MWPPFLSSLEVGSLLILGKGDGRWVLGQEPGRAGLDRWGHWSGVGKTEEPKEDKPYLTVRRGSAQDLGTEEDGPWVLELWARMTLCGGSI